jgi:hypothetical protein
VAKNTKKTREDHISKGLGKGNPTGLLKSGPPTEVSAFATISKDGARDGGCPKRDGKVETEYVYTLNMRSVGVIDIYNF